MQDSIGKITAIFLAAVLLFLVPLSLYFQRQDNLHQLYVMTETVYLTDAVRNTGRLTEGMYEEFKHKLESLGNIYEISLRHTRFTYRKPEEAYLEQPEHFYTAEILSALYEEGEYRFLKDDFFRVEVIRKNHTPGERIFKNFTGAVFEEGTVEAYYGGSIKYEMD